MSEKAWRLQTMIIPSEGDSIKWILVLDTDGEQASQEYLEHTRTALNERAKELGAEGALLFNGRIDVV